MTILKNEFTIKKAQKEKSPKKPLLKNSTKHLTELTPILHHFFKKKKKNRKGENILKFILWGQPALVCYQNQPESVSCSVVSNSLQLHGL